MLISNPSINNKKGWNMNLAIKTLEEIGQNTSIKQHDNLIEMLSSLEIQKHSIDNINLKTQEFVCALLPADDEDETETDGNDEEE